MFAPLAPLDKTGRPHLTSAHQPASTPFAREINLSVNLRPFDYETRSPPVSVAIATTVNLNI